MQNPTAKRIIIDTNVLISFLIGKRIKKLRTVIANSGVVLIFNELLIQELLLVTQRPKFRSYFKATDVTEFISLIRIIGKFYSTDSIPCICRDPKDDFLLALSDIAKADFLITGDNDLLELKIYHKTKIVSAAEFELLLHS